MRELGQTMTTLKAIVEGIQKKLKPQMQEQSYDVSEIDVGMIMHQVIPKQTIGEECIGIVHH